MIENKSFLPANLTAFRTIWHLSNTPTIPFIIKELLYQELHIFKELILKLIIFYSLYISFQSDVVEL